MQTETLASFAPHVERLGIALSPSDDSSEREGVLNPASTRTRDGKLLLYPRCVAEGNVSRVGLYESSGSAGAPVFDRLGFALEPREESEIRTDPGGYGCEDPRVTFVPALDAYLMAFTAFGPIGPRIAVAISHDGYVWERIGLMDFSQSRGPSGDDKDGIFFPEPVLSPSGVRSFAFYHRPMVLIHAQNTAEAAPIILAKPAIERECTRIGYVPVDAVLADRTKLLEVAESAVVLVPEGTWGLVKNGGGTPPVRIAEGWMSVFHGVDAKYDENGVCVGMKYQAGIVIHDLERPHIVRYRSPEPVLVPETHDECSGIVANVVFPTAIDVRPGAAERDFDIYYGMADCRIGRARMVFPAP